MTGRGDLAGIPSRRASLLRGAAYLAVLVLLLPVLALGARPVRDAWDRPLERPVPAPNSFPPGLGPYLDDARLVVLSACESALPVDAPDATAEGGAPLVSIAGLAAQFRRAGVDSLVASLWKVDDEGTRRLMTELYRQLAAGSDLAHAMQRAQLSLLRQPTWADPFYWAGFEVVGDWR